MSRFLRPHRGSRSMTGNEVQDFAVSGAHGKELLIGQRFAVLADDGDVVSIGMRVDADEVI